MTEAEAADSRLRSWLRRSGRPANYGKKYGSLPDEEDDIAVGSIAPEEAGRVGTAIRAARRCRSIICAMFGALACLAGAVLLVYVYLQSAPDDLSFVTIGDWGCGPINCAVPPGAPEGYHHGGLNTKNVAFSMARTAENIGSKFVLALGDNFYWRGVHSATDPLWKSVWEQPFDYPSLQTPWYAILGNHDHYGNPEAQIEFSRQDLDCKQFGHCPSRWVLPRYWYSVVHPSARNRFDVQFVFIDTVILAQSSSHALAQEKARMGALDPQDLQRWEQWAKEMELMGKLQLEWLEQTLNASTADWLIVVGHYPVFSGGEHGDTPELQHQVKPLLEKYNVDAYLGGHDHTLQMLHRDGVHYFVSGSGSFNGEYHPKPESLFGSVECGFMAHRIMPSRMDVSIIDLHGKTLYRSFIPRKRNRLRGGLVGELAGVEKEWQMEADKIYKIF